MQRYFHQQIDTIAVDLPGHADSLETVWKSPKASAETILAEIGVNHRKLHIVGHSMGGAVASLVALIAPRRVASLTLLAPGGFGPEIAHDTLLRWAKAETAEQLAEIVPLFFADGAEISPKIVEMHVQLRKREGAVETLTSIGEGLARDGKQGVLPLDALWQTPAKISVIWGELDRILPSSQAHALRPNADAGHLRLHLLENVGHSPAEEATDFVREVITENISHT